MAQLRPEARTDPDAVRDIIDTERTDLELNAFINAASYKVDEIVDTAPDTDPGLLADIEKWLTAHLLTTRNEVVEREEQESFGAYYLRETTYGETAISLDPSGVLAAGTSGVLFTTPDAKGTRYP